MGVHEAGDHDGLEPETGSQDLEQESLAAVESMELDSVAAVEARSHSAVESEQVAVGPRNVACGLHRALEAAR
ncbi:hypothetical protein P3T76_012147 [Phytophthora citrophthora]|uniref:Uncharacterized protein n=1 Tax=Phytophthora citrophthora TaxID=4793 RepID=A0AAD9G659_9STRA|nr:hypothetical protein P3T76_012147 [Phytophthora citrophthora]